MQDILTNMLKDQVRGQLQKQIANQLNLKDGQAQDMIENSLPYLLGGLQKNTQTEKGAKDLFEALKSEKHDGSALLDIEKLAQNPEGAGGDKILKHVFGSKEAAIEAEIAKKTGTDPEKAKKTLMTMAPLVMAALGKVVKSEKLNPDKLSGIVNDLAKNKDLGGAGQKLVMQMLDQDGDGDIKDDFFRLAKNWIGTKLTRK